jgi:hypothetical protein
VAKDRARPFSRKHRRYWIPVLGGMISIGLINLVIGFLTYTPAPDEHEQIPLHVHQRPDEPTARLTYDAGVPDAPARDAARAPDAK